MRRSARAAWGIALFAAVAAVGAAADATLVEPFRLTTSVVEIPAGSLSAALGGARIVHLSDLHLKGFGLRERRLLAALREQDPALVLVTGDYADTPAGVEAVETLFSQVRPPLGVLAVPGNNDYFRGMEEAIFSALRGAGARLLRNDAVILKGAGGRFAVAGVDDPFFGRDDVKAALEKVPPDVPVVLIAHSPAILEARSEAMLFNAGDAAGPWGKGWFWADGSHFRGASPAIAFARTGRHRARIQRREDGVGVMTLRLVPVADAKSQGRSLRGLQGIGRPPPGAGAGDVVIEACSSAVDLRGTWRRAETAQGDCFVEDAPDAGLLASHPLVDPPGWVDLEFEAPAGVVYEVWVRLHSPTSVGRSDSLYLQFEDAVDASGASRFRIGSEVPAASSPSIAAVLAGHTHGGQVRLPWLGPVERSIAKGPFVMGRYDRGAAMVYISRGIGVSYLPVRFGCPPEIVVLTSPRPEIRT